MIPSLVYRTEQDQCEPGTFCKLLYILSERRSDMSKRGTASPDERLLQGKRV